MVVVSKVTKHIFGIERVNDDSFRKFQDAQFETKKVLVIIQWETEKVDVQIICLKVIISCSFKTAA